MTDTPLSSLYARRRPQQAPLAPVRVPLKALKSLKLPIAYRDTRSDVQVEAFVDRVPAPLKAAVGSPLLLPQEHIPRRAMNDDGKQQYPGLGVSVPNDDPDWAIVSAKKGSTELFLPKFSKSGKYIPQDGSPSMSQVGMGWFPEEIADSPDSPPSPWAPGARFRMPDRRQYGAREPCGPDLFARPAALQAPGVSPSAALGSIWPTGLIAGTAGPHTQAAAQSSPQGPVWAEYFTESPVSYPQSSEVRSSKDDSDSFVEITETDYEISRLNEKIDKVIDLFKGLSSL